MQERKRTGAGLALVAALLIVALLAVAATPGGALAQAKERFKWAVMDKLTVLEGGATFNSAATFNDTVTMSSSDIDLDGNDLIIDSDGDSILDENSDDAIRMTVGATSGTFSVLTGNLKVGDGSPSTTQNGEDAYVEGLFEADGTARFDGAIDANSSADIAGNLTSATGAVTVTDNVLIDGQADAVQLAVQGHSSQTELPLVVEQSDGTDVFTVSNAGAVVAASSVTADSAAIGGGYGSTGSTLSSAGNIQANGNLTVDGTSDLVGNIADSGGDLTVDDNLVVTGTTDQQGNVADSGGDFTVDDNIAVTGTSDLQGDVTLENDETISNATDGTITLTVAAAGNVQVDTGNLAVGDGTPGDASMDGEDAYVEGELEVDGAAYFDGAVDMDSTLSVSDTLTLGSDGIYFGSASFTDTTTVTLGLTTVSGCVVSLDASDLLDNEEQHVGCEDNSGDLTIKVLKEDGSAGDSAVTVYYWAWGQ